LSVGRSAGSTALPVVASKGTVTYASPASAAIDRRLGLAEPEQDTQQYLQAIRDEAFADASSALVQILQWACRSHRGHNNKPDPAIVGAKLLSLMVMLHPEESPFASLTEVADAIGMTRAAPSKWMIELRDEVGCLISVGKLQGSRDKYRQAQLRSVAKAHIAAVALIRIDRAQALAHAKGMSLFWF
jgi:biotin operon repressor